MQATEWMTTAEGAEYLKVKRRTFLQWVRQGKTKAFQLSGNIRTTMNICGDAVTSDMREASGKVASLALNGMWNVMEGS